MSNPFDNPHFNFYEAPNKGIMKGLQSPLQEEFKDNDYQHTALILDFVPFMDSGDATLRVVRDLSQLSPTQAACINSKLDYCTGGGLGFIKLQDSVFKRQNNTELPITDREHNDYAAFLDSVIDTNALMGQIQTVMRNDQTYGNAVLELVLTETAGVRGASINVYDAAMFRYKRKNGEVLTNAGYVSQRWDYYYLNRNLSSVVEYAMYPAFKEHEDGTFRSLIHIKTDALYRNWYGLPSSFAGIYFQFMEYQLGKYTTRGYENMWLPSVFIETYDMPFDTDTERAEINARELVNQLANVYTNRGDGTKLPAVFRMASPDTKPSTITPFSSQTHENFHDLMSGIAQRQILKAHSWHSSLLEKTVGSIGNNSENADLAMITDKTVIRPLQAKVIAPFRAAIKSIEDWVGYKNTSNLTIDLKSVFEAPTQPEINNPQNTMLNA